MPDAAYFNDEVDSILFPDASRGEMWFGGRTPGVCLPKAAADGTLLLSYGTAKRADAVLTATIWIATAQVTTPATENRVGLYTEASDGALTLVASSASDTTLFDGTGAVSVAFSASYTLIPGQRYAFGVLATGTVGPVLLAAGGTGTDNEGLILNATPRMAAMFAGQTDLPSTIANASLAAQTTAGATKPGRVIARLV